MDETYRFIICVDIDAENDEAAYKLLREQMDLIKAGSGLNWESTDEAYMPDGDPVDPKRILEIIMKSV
jgi:hypothetical protein